MKNHQKVGVGMAVFGLVLFLTSLGIAVYTNWWTVVLNIVDLVHTVTSVNLHDAEPTGYWLGALLWIIGLMVAGED